VLLITVSTPGQGAIMPEIHLKTSSDESIKLTDFQNEVFLLTAMSTACSSCKLQTSYLKEIASTNPSLRIISVSVDTNLDTIKSLRQYKSENKLNWLVALDEDHELQVSLSINSYPQTFIFDKELTQVKRWVGIAQSSEIINELQLYTDVVSPNTGENQLLTSLMQNLFFIIWVMIIISIYPLYLTIKYILKLRKS